jgi:hypothetical protein
LAVELRKRAFDQFDVHRIRRMVAVAGPCAATRELITSGEYR